MTLQHTRALICVTALTLFASAVAAETDAGRAAPCGTAMSCTLESPRMSVPAPSYSPMIVAVTDAGELLPKCTQNFRGRSSRELIAACEVFLDTKMGRSRDTAIGLYHLGHAYTYAGRFDDAIAVWNEASARDPDYVEPLLAIGKWLALGSDPLSANAFFDRALAIDAREARARAGKARAYFQANRFGEALEESAAAVALDPNDATARQFHGRMLEFCGSYKEAAAEYALATKGYDERKPRTINLVQDGNPWLDLARALDKSGEHKQAAAAIDAYLQSIPPEMAVADLFAARGAYREAAGAYAGAAEDLARAAAMSDPEQASAFAFRRVFLLHKAGLPDKALREIELLLRKGDARMVLRLQVFLKNEGRDGVEITGQFDDITRKALLNCLAEAACGGALGRKS